MSVNNTNSSVEWALLVAATDTTQTYVFESEKLPEIRGASRQLDDLNERIGYLVVEQEGECIYPGGGGWLACLAIMVMLST